MNSVSKIVSKVILAILFAALTACSGGGGGGATTPPPVSAGIAVSPGVLSTTEDSTEISFSVSLRTKPSSDVEMTFTSRDTTEGLIDSDTDTDWLYGAGTWSTDVDLTFTADNWNVPQTVKVKGQPDYTVDGNQTYAIDVTWVWSMDLGYINIAKPSISVTNIDTSAPGITVSKSEITTTEGGTSASFTIRLNLAPTSTVTIPLTINDASEGSFDYYGSITQKDLTFDQNNWSIAQTVYVYGINDSATDGNQTYTISVGPTTSNDASYIGLAGNDISVTNTDNDTAAYTVSKTNIATNEWGQTATFTVALNTEPGADVVIPVTSQDASEGLVSSFALPSPASSFNLTFTPTNWQSPQTVTVTPANDADQDGDISYAVVVGAPTGDTAYAALASKTVTVLNVDDDTARVNIQGANLQTTESGSTASFVVSLAKEPAGNVVLNITSADTTEGRVKGGSSPSVPLDAITLTFTTADWQTAQTVTVVGQDDVEIDGNQTYAVGVAVDTGLTEDSAYDALTAQAVNVTNSDGDVAGTTVAGYVDVNESGTTDTFTVKLNTKPTADVIIPITLEDASQIQVSGNGTTFASTLNLTFTPTNWSTAQTVTVKAVDDLIDESYQYLDITMGAASSADSYYNGLAAKVITAYVSDNDTAGLVITPSTVLTTTELTSTTFTLALATQPTVNVFVTVTSGNSAEGLVTGGDNPITPTDALTLEFTAANWQSGQTITVHGKDDAVLDGPVSYNLTVSVIDGTDTYYNGVGNKLISVTNYDNEAGVSENKTLARTELPYNGQVAKAAVSTYSLTGLAAGWKHTLTASNVTDDIALTIKDGVTILCSSTNVGIKANESCMFKVPASGAVTVEVNGAITNNGAGFTLSLSAPGYPVTFETYGADWIRIKLYSSDVLSNPTVAALENDYSFSGSLSVTHDLMGGQTYYLRVAPYSASDIGAYKVQVTLAAASLKNAGLATAATADIANDAVNATALTLDTPIDSYLSDSDVDWYKYTAPAAPY